MKLYIDPRIVLINILPSSRQNQPNFTCYLPLNCKKTLNRLQKIHCTVCKNRAVLPEMFSCTSCHFFMYKMQTAVWYLSNIPVTVDNTLLDRFDATAVTKVTSCCFGMIQNVVALVSQILDRL